MSVPEHVDATASKGIVSRYMRPSTGRALSRTANDVVGFIAGVLTFTPYQHWRWEHALHHATAGDLDRRGTGDIWTMTVQEYLESSRWKRFAYRLSRNPVILGEVLRRSAATS